MDLLGYRFHVVFQSIEFNQPFIFIKNGVAGSRILVTGLTYRSGIDDDAFFFIEPIHTTEIGWWIELRLIGEDTGHMGMSNEAVLVDQIEDLTHLHRGVDGIFGEDVFIDGPSW